jgi:hypothetical protein
VQTQQTQRPRVIQKRRRNNAPVRPYRRTSTASDVVLALGVCTLTMGIVFVLVSYLDHSAKAEAEIARLFGVALLLTGLFLAALSFGLSPADRTDFVPYVYPTLVGLIIGGIEASLFLAPVILAMPVPFLLLIVLVDPVRRRVERMATPGRRVTG